MKNLQTDLKQLYQWSQTWQLSKAICISNKRLPRLFINHVSLHWVNTFKYLGINQKLKWGDQVISSTSKATKVLNTLHRNMHGHKNAKKRAYQALVWPLLEFSVPVWSPYQWKDAYIRT